MAFFGLRKALAGIPGFRVLYEARTIPKIEHRTKMKTYLPKALV